MQPTAVSPRELVLSLQRRLAMLHLLERRLHEREAILTKAYREYLETRGAQMGRMRHGRRQSFTGREDGRYDQRI